MRSPRPRVPRGAFASCALAVTLSGLAGCQPQSQTPGAAAPDAGPARVAQADGGDPDGPLQSLAVLAAADTPDAGPADPGLAPAQKPPLPPKPAEIAPPPTPRAADVKEVDLLRSRVHSYFAGHVGRRLHLQTDKPMYKPGETVWIKVWDLDARSLASSRSDSSIDVELVNPRGAVVLRRKLREQRGGAQADLPLGDGSVGGEYTLRVRTADGHKAERPLVVASYEAPRLQLKLDFLRKAYGPGDEVSATIAVRRATGEPLRDHALTGLIRVDGQDLPPVSLRTGETGEGVVRFPLPGNIEVGDGLLTVLAEDGGLTESVARRVPIIVKKLSLNVYPEGGDLVEGLPGRVYFEAKNPLGKPADVSGRVVDDQGKTVWQFDSVRDGLGRFDMLPAPGRSYHLEVDRPVGIAERTPLPPARPSGCVLRSYDDLDGELDVLRVSVRCTEPQRVVVSALLRENLLDAAAVDVPAGAPAVVYLQPQGEAAALARAQGVAWVTLCDQDLNPLAERLVYRHRRARLQVKVEPQKKAYSPRETVELALQTLDPDGRPVAADVALGAADDTVLTLADDKTGHMLSRLYLEPELHGKIEEPNFYFDLGEDKSALGLDLLMGTRGYRRIEMRPVGGPVAKNDPHRKGDETPVPDFGGLTKRRPAEKKPLELAVADPQLVRKDKAAAPMDALAPAKTEAEARRPDAPPPPKEQAAAALPQGRAPTTPPMATPTPAEPAGPLPPMAAALQATRAPAHHANQPIQPKADARVAAPHQKLAARPKADLDVLLDGPPRDLARNNKALAGPAPAPRIVAAKPAPPRKAPIEIAGPAERPMRAHEAPMAAADQKRIPGALGVKGKGEATGAGFGLGNVGAVGRGRLMRDEDGLLMGGDDRHMGGLVLAPRPRPRPRVEYAPVRVFPLPAYAPDYDGPRTDFRETVFFAGDVRTDGDGKATVRFPLSDAITAFRVVAEGVGGGAAGRSETVIKSSLPFSMAVKVPLAVSEGDHLELPLQLTNERDRPIAVDLTASFGDLLKLDRPVARTQGTIQPGAREALFYPLTVTGKRGSSSLRFAASAGGLRDEFVRDIVVSPRGFPQHTSKSGQVRDRFVADLDLGVMLPGTADGKLRLYPSPVASMVSGLEGLLQEPSGCFEQASSTNYPNVMILRYLKVNRHADPALLGRTSGLLDTGYKRLIGYETPRKGYEWFGAAPANEALTAYGLLEFTDMQEVYDDVDREMVRRTAAWLRSRRDGQGGYLRDGKAIDSFGHASKEVTDAYITYSLSEAKVSGIDAELAAAERLSQRTEDAYLLGLATGALLNTGRRDAAAAAVTRLLAMQDESGGFLKAGHSITRSGGTGLHVETTALAVLALMKAGGQDEAVRRGVEWLVSHRGGYGQWGATQGTVLALKALTAYAVASRRTQTPGDVTVLVNGQVAGREHYEAGRRAPIVFATLDRHLRPGQNRVEIVHEGQAPLPFSLGLDYRALKPATSPQAPLQMTTALERDRVGLGESVRLNVTVRNRTEGGLPMTLVRVGLPGGLVFQTWQLKELRDKGLIAFYETAPREVNLYLRQMKPREELRLPLDLQAAVPGHYTGPASRAYLYYTSEHKTWTDGVAVTITP